MANPIFLCSVQFYILHFLLHRIAVWFTPHTSHTWRSTMRWDMIFWIPDMRPLDWRTYRQCSFSLLLLLRCFWNAITSKNVNTSWHLVYISLFIITLMSMCLILKLQRPIATGFIILLKTCGFSRALFFNSHLSAWPGVTVWWNAETLVFTTPLWTANWHNETVGQLWMWSTWWQIPPLEWRVRGSCGEIVFHSWSLLQLVWGKFFFTSIYLFFFHISCYPFMLPSLPFSCLCLSICSSCSSLP